MKSVQKAAISAACLGFLAVTGARAGTFSETPLVLTPAADADASTGVNPSAVYTHAFDIGGNGAVINGVTFDGAGTSSAAPYSGTGAAAGSGGGAFTLAGATTPFANNGAGQGNNLDTASGIYDLTNNFIYSGGAGEAAGVQTLTLTGLTGGQSYVASFYTAGFAGASQVIDADDDGTLNQLTTDRGDEKVIRYSYTQAAGDSDIVFTFDSVNNTDAFHQYGFSNQVVPEPTSLALVGLGGLGLLARPRRT